MYCSYPLDHLDTPSSDPPTSPFWAISPSTDPSAVPHKAFSGVVATVLGPQVQQKGGYPPRKGPRPTGSDRLAVLKYPFPAPDPSKEALYPLSTPLLGGTWAISCDSYTRFGVFGVLSGSCAHAFARFVGHFARVMYTSVRLIIVTSSPACMSARR